MDPFDYFDPEMRDAMSGVDSEPAGGAPEYDELDDFLSAGGLLQMFGGDLGTLQQTLRENFAPQQPSPFGQLAGRGNLDEALVGGINPDAMVRTAGGVMSARGAARERFKKQSGFDPRSMQNRVTLPDGTVIERTPEGGLTRVPGASIYTAATQPYGELPQMGEPATGGMSTAEYARLRDAGSPLADQTVRRDTQRPIPTVIRGGFTKGADTSLTPEQEASAERLFGQRAERLRGIDPRQYLMGEVQAGRRGGLAELAQTFAAAERQGDTQKKEQEQSFSRAFTVLKLMEQARARDEDRALKKSTNEFRRAQVREKVQTDALLSRNTEEARNALKIADKQFKDDPAGLAAMYAKVNERKQAQADAIREGQNPYAEQKAAQEKMAVKGARRPAVDMKAPVAKFINDMGASGISVKDFQAKVMQGVTPQQAREWLALIRDPGENDEQAAEFARRVREASTSPGGLKKAFRGLFPYEGLPRTAKSTMDLYEPAMSLLLPIIAAKANEPE